MSPVLEFEPTIRELVFVDGEPAYLTGDEARRLLAEGHEVWFNGPRAA